MRGDDGRVYIVKTRDNPYGTRILVNDLFGAQLCRLVGLPTPDFAVIMTDDGNQSPGFGSRFAVSRRIYESLPESAWHLIDNPSVLVGAYVFDAWTANLDSRQFLFERRTKPLQIRMMLIDNGHCFGARSWCFHDLRLHCPSNLKHAYDEVRDCSEFEPWLSRIELVDRNQINLASSDVPDEWLRGSERAIFDRLKAELSQRAQNIRARVQRLLAGKHSPFSLWYPDSALIASPSARRAGLVQLGNLS